MLDSKIGLLQKLSIFKGIPPRHLQTIVDVSKKAFFEPGEAIISAGEAGNKAFLVLTGAANCFRMENGGIEERSFGAGTLIGEMAMLVDTVHSFTVTAKTRLRALAITRDDLRNVMQNEPIIAQSISENLLSRLKELAIELRSIDSSLARMEIKANAEVVALRRRA